MSDEKFFLIATNEYDDGNVDDALLAKAMTVALGDETKAKYLYIQYRVDQLTVGESILSKQHSSKTTSGHPIYKQNDIAPVFESSSSSSEATLSSTPQPASPENDLVIMGRRHLLAEHYATINARNHALVIEEIREGKLYGRKYNDHWYVEVDNDPPSPMVSTNVEWPDVPTQMVTTDVETFARDVEDEASSIISGIREGRYQGRKQGDQWYIDPQSYFANHSTQHPSGHSIVADNLKDSSSLNSWLRFGLFAQMFIGVVCAISSMMQFNLLDKMGRGAFYSQAAMEAAANANDEREAALGVAFLVVWLVSGVIILRWIYRANQIARAKGAQDMTVTPGWSVGWYFVPVMWFWKPYQAMKEIWQATVSPSDWHSVETPGIFPLWWALFIGSNVLGQVIFRMSQRDGDIEYLQSISSITAVSHVIDIVLAIVFLKLANRLISHQRI